MEEQNYLKEIVICLLVVVAILIDAPFVPAWNMGGLPVKRVNVFSNIVSDVLPKQELMQRQGRLSQMAHGAGTVVGRVRILAFLSRPTYKLYVSFMFLQPH